MELYISANRSANRWEKLSVEDARMDQSCLGSVVCEKDQENS